MEQQLTDVTRSARCDKHGAEYEETRGKWRNPFAGSDHYTSWRGDCPACRGERHAAFAATKAANEAAAAECQLLERIHAANVPRHFLESRLDNYEANHPGQKHALRVASEYAGNFERHLDSGHGLLFFGKPGCGKTRLAVAIGMAVMEMGCTARYTTASGMVRRFTDAWGRRDGEKEASILIDLTSTDLLIIDEAGAISGSEVDKRTVFNVIDGRYLEDLPTLVISNLPANELPPRFGEPATDRLRETSELVAFDWKSYRQSHKAGRKAA